jgi:GTPase SAR1 family protein
MYDLTLHDSFDAMQDWLNEVKQNTISEVLIFLVGNMLDIEEEREVSADEAAAFAAQNSLDGVYEGSAKTSANVTQ